MKEKLQEYALVAQMISAIAVVLSLLFVGYQIRESTEQSRLNSIISMTDAYYEQALNYVHNEPLGVAWHKVLEGEVLNAREVDMLGTIFMPT